MQYYESGESVSQKSSKRVFKTPTIIIDSREKQPLSFDGLHIRGVPKLDVVVHKLDAGDYSVQSMENEVFIERKSAQDLYGTLFQGRERFERELERARAYKYRYLVIESTPFGFAQYMEWHRRDAQFNAAFSTLIHYAERYGLKIRWLKTREGSADYVARLALHIYGAEKKGEEQCQEPQEPSK